MHKCISPWGFLVSRAPSRGWGLKVILVPTPTPENWQAFPKKNKKKKKSAEPHTTY